jgi:hypothetical protein
VKVVNIGFSEVLMKKIVLGLIFVLFNFNITLGNSVMNLIPTFLGYFFIMNACVSLADKTSNNRYLETRKLALLLFVINLFIYALDLLGLGAINPFFSAVVGILNLALSLFFLHRLTQSITETSQFNLSEVWIKEINSIFKWIVVLSIAGTILLIAPIFALLVLVISIVFHVRYIYQLHTLNQTLDSQYL